jgi:polyphosphate kinase
MIARRCAPPSMPRAEDASSSAVQQSSLEPVWRDRDRSCLEFNRRVLANALDDRMPLLERV